MRYLPDEVADQVLKYIWEEVKSGGRSEYAKHFSAVLNNVTPKQLINWMISEHFTEDILETLRGRPRQLNMREVDLIVYCGILRNQQRYGQFQGLVREMMSVLYFDIAKLEDDMEIVKNFAEYIDAQAM